METRQNELLDRLLNGVLRDCFRVQMDNFDQERFPEKGAAGLRRRGKEKFLAVVAKIGFVRRQFNVDHASHSFARIIRQIERYQKLYDSLADQQSRDLLVALLKFRVLGCNHVRLPLNDARYWELRKRVNRHLRERETRRVAGWALNRYQLDGDNKIQMHLDKLGVRTTFLIEHYAYRGGETIVAEPGDVVIDAGGCWGDTALYFAEKISSSGRVFCCEFDPVNLEILEDNLRLNPALQTRVHILRIALWDKSDETIDYVARGPGTALNASGPANGTVITTLSIDDLAAREKLARVDVIKMDIEGAELRALQGAEQVLRRFRPKLAISLYHKPDDLLDIPEYVRGLGLDYRFFLGHYTIHHEETVLFATARKK
jgi:FkbM family methyltransferase